MSEHLRLVEPPREERAEAIHPDLEDVMPNIWHFNADNVLEAMHVVRFGRTFGAYELLEHLSTPVEGVIDGFSYLDIRQGLRSLTYPNSRAMKNARFIQAHAREQLITLRPQIHGLLDVIDHARGEQVLPIKVHVYDQDLAELTIQDQLAHLNPSELRGVADHYGVSIDEVKLWRLKRGRDRNKPIDLDAVLNANNLLPQVVEDRFHSKIALPLQRPILIPTADLADCADWAREPGGYIELTRRLDGKLTPVARKGFKVEEDDKADEVVAERWEALLRREGAPRHVVRPQIAWQFDETQYNRSLVDRSNSRTVSPGIARLFQRFAYPDQAPRYNAINHTVEHISSLLGPIMLASNLEPQTFAGPLRRLQAGRHYRYWDRPELPRKSAGLLPALLQSNYIVGRLMNTVEFRTLEKLAMADLDERV